MLNVMTTSCQKDGKEFFLVTSKEWDLLKKFTDEVLSFREAIKIFFKSKSITSPYVTSIFDLLLNQLNTLIVVLENPCQDVVGKPMSIELYHNITISTDVGGSDVR